MTTYYISPSGNDLNDGLTTATAWQTITKVNATTFSAGDRILFQGGQTFSGNLVMDDSGTSLSPITISTYGTGNATISCGTGTGIQIQNCSYVEVSNFVIVGPGVTCNGATSSTTSIGYGIYALNTTTQSTTVSTYRTGHRINNVTISGCYGGIYFVSNGGSSTSPFPVGFDNAHITNCIIHDCLVNGICIIAGSSLNASFANASGQPAYSKNIYIADCITYNIYGASTVATIYTGSGIVLNNCTTSLIERCLAYNCGQANGNVGGGPVGIWFNEATYSIIQSCEVHHQHDGKNIDGGAYDFDGGTQHCTIQYSYSHDNDGTSLISGTYSGSSATTANTFRYNICQNDGIRNNNAICYREFGTPTSTILHNNVFCCNTTNNQSGYLITSSAASFYNNILYCLAGINFLNAVGSGAYAGNLYWITNGTFSITYNGVTYASLAAFRAVQETAGGSNRGINADPLFAVTPGSSGTILPTNQLTNLTDYTLRQSSPAIGTGLDLLTLFGISPGTRDFLGSPISSSAGLFDIGACQSRRQGGLINTHSHRVF